MSKYQKILADFLDESKDSKPALSVGKHNDVPDSEFDANELAMGIEVEKEHTDDEAIAKEIAKDHLSELPTYYSLLKAMEEKGKKEFGEESEGCPCCEEADFQEILSKFLGE